MDSDSPYQLLSRCIELQLFSINSAQMRTAAPQPPPSLQPPTPIDTYQLELDPFGLTLIEDTKVNVDLIISVIVCIFSLHYTASVEDISEN